MPAISTISATSRTTSQATVRPRVVLVHGLFMGRHAMLFLARQLKRSGFRVSCFAHNTITGSLERNAQRLAAFVQREQGPVVLVGHSLGGLVSLQSAGMLPAGDIAALVLLGSPYQGAQAGQALRRLLGPRSTRIARALHEWSSQSDKPTVSVPVFTLAGTRSTGLGRVLCGFKEPNDGTVTVTETCYPNAVTAVMPVSHTGMLFDRHVAEQVVQWLRDLPTTH